MNLHFSIINGICIKKGNSFLLGLKAGKALLFLSTGYSAGCMQNEVSINGNFGSCNS
jgi:hypothetical protein